MSNSNYHISKCIVPKCTTVRTSADIIRDCKLFKFPKDAQAKEEWAKRCKIDVNQIKSSSHICSKHFKATYFEPNRKTITLKNGAIPTIFKSNIGREKDRIDLCSQCHEISDNIIVARQELSVIKAKMTKQKSYDNRIKNLKQKIKNSRIASSKSDRVIAKLRRRLRAKRNKYIKLNSLSLALIASED